MQISSAIEYQRLGLFTRLYGRMENFEWILYLEGNDELWILTTALGHDKKYSTLDSLFKEISRITGVPEFVQFS